MFTLIFGVLILAAVLLFVPETVALGWHRSVRRLVKKALNKIQD
jgi:hypothetical protein